MVVGLEVEIARGTLLRIDLGRTLKSYDKFNCGRSQLSFSIGERHGELQCDGCNDEPDEQA